MVISYKRVIETLYIEMLLYNHKTFEQELFLKYFLQKCISGKYLSYKPFARRCFRNVLKTFVLKTLKNVFHGNTCIQAKKTHMFLIHTFAGNLVEEGDFFLETHIPHGNCCRVNDGKTGV